MSDTVQSSICATDFPALSPEISADLMDDLVAAVPRSSDSGTESPFAGGATLVSEVDALHPRDLEETILATQVLAAHHSAMACFRAAAQHDPASKEASRLRRDALTLQRAMAAVLRTLHKSQARPVQENEDDLLPRPTVPTTPPPSPPRATTTRRRKPGETAASTPSRRAEDMAEFPSAADETRDADGGPSGTEPVVHSPPPDVFAERPELQRLRDRWYSLPRWEDMTMEERRETFGYSDNPPEATGSGPDTRPPALE